MSLFPIIAEYIMSRWLKNQSQEQLEQRRLLILWGSVIATLLILYWLVRNEYAQRAGIYN
jgi:hypothetical protein